MKIEYAFFALSAELRPEGSFSVFGGDIDAIQAPVPFVFPQLFLLAKVLVRHDECGIEHVVSLVVTDPQGNPVRTEPARQVFNPPKIDEGSAVGMTILMKLNNLKFDIAGKYTWRLLIDDKELDTLIFKITALEHEPAVFK